MRRKYRIVSLVVGAIFIASIFSFLPSVAAYSPSSSIPGTIVQSRPNTIVGLKPGGNGPGGGGGGGHSGGGGGGGGFKCPTISGAGSSVCSTNWSGWVDTASSGAVTVASGSWIVPTLSCPSSGTTYVALWVGIDGYTSSTVEQTGILGECNNGAASYFAWYEFYPNPMYQVFSVNPGDVITASVTASSSNDFTISIATNGGTSYTTSQIVSGAARSSAEWIVERPALCLARHCTMSTLANFGTSYFGQDNTGVSNTNYATINGVNEPIGYSSFTNAAITMVGSSSGPILAEPSSLSTAGTSFSVT